MLSSCDDPPAGHVDDGTDCDDDNVSAYPGSVAEATSGECMLDADGDGYGDASAPSNYDPGTDCADDNVSAYPGSVAEATSGECMLDADGDGYGDASAPSNYDPGTDCADDNDSAYPGSVAEATSGECMLDADGDGYGDASAPSNYDPGTDCADDNVSAYPGSVAEATSGECMLDADGDGYGDASAPSNYDPGTDCADDNVSAYPGSVAEATSGECMLDADGDGYGDASAPSNYDPGTDCADDNVSANPGEAEVCDTLDVDEDCNGLSDDDDPDVAGKLDYAPDVDGDGYGDETTPEAWCDAPSGLVADATDCDDSNASANPGEAEVCDTLDVDEDCNGLSDDDDPDAAGKLDYAPDTDGDGYGDETTPEAWCNAPSGLVADATDCDDTDASTYPGASEVGVGLLEDLACDGVGGSLVRADFAFIGENGNDRAGFSVSTAGDVDDDGLDDLFVGASGTYGSGSAAGKAYLILGSSLAASTSSTIDLSNADFAFIGENSNDSAGFSVSTAGDVDGDGLDDLFVGAYLNSDGASSAGKAYLLLGSTLAASTSASIDLSNADFAFIGENISDNAGYILSSAGDVDGDGLDDLFVGALSHDGDGGCGGDCGKAYLILGSTLAASTSSTIDLSNADFEFIGENVSNYAGSSVSPAGDVDGDGLDDLLVGAWGNDDGGSTAGKAYLLLGSTLAASTSSTIDLSNADFAFIGENSDDSAGRSVSPAGDVDGDGLDDLFVGAPYNDDGGSYAGKAYLLLGSTLVASTSSTIDLSNADFAFVGENIDNAAGFSVSTAGDVDGDGLDDLFVGAYLNSDGASNAGKAYLLLGSTLAASTSATIDLSNADFGFFGENSNDYAGSSVSSAGDVDGDGLDDLLVGAYFNDDGGSNAGKVYLIFGHQ